MVNGIPINGYATDIPMDIQSSNTAIANNTNLINLGNLNDCVNYISCKIECFLFIGTLPQPNIHPGSISSTGRQRVSTATSTVGAQLIGGGISPTLFTSSQVENSVASILI